MKRLLPLGPLLLVFGCWGANDSALFSPTDGPPSAGAGSGGSSSTGAQAGTDSSSGSSASAPSGGSLSSSGNGGTGGTNVDPSSGGSAAASGGGVGGGGASGGSGGSLVVPPVIESCDMVTGAVVSPLNGHCYRVNFENLTFAAARDACVAAGGHLVTISSAEENDFVRDLQHSEHWIGATDGRPDTTPGAGPYGWVDDEPWVYADWQSGQPNAFGTKCPAGTGSTCYEHCAYQTSGGDWIDRSCWHTIVSVCEWDVEPASAGGASGGAP